MEGASLIQGWSGEFHDIELKGQYGVRFSKPACKNLAMAAIICRPPTDDFSSDILNKISSVHN
jgi:hypothetical protein